MTGRCAPSFTAHCLEGRFPDPTPRLEAPEALYSPAKPAIFSIGAPPGHGRAGRPGRRGSAAARGMADRHVQGRLGAPRPAPGLALPQIEKASSPSARAQATSCADCSKRKKKCEPAHLLGEEHRGEESKGEEGEAEWEEDALAPFRRVALPGDLGAGIRDRAIGRRREKVHILPITNHLALDHLLRSFYFRKQSERHQSQQL